MDEASLMLETGQSGVGENYSLLGRPRASDPAPASRECPTQERGNRSTPREGPSLLQGLVICGICGSRMTVGYRQRKAGLAPDYICAGPLEVDRKGYCQRISGYSLDLAVGATLVETVTPLALEVALSVQQEIQSRWDEADRLRRLQVDRARYESELARRRFLRVDPDNRLVAASLEAEWNARLRALAEAEQNYQRQCQADQFKISAVE
jgi:hypothetical protein